MSITIERASINCDPIDHDYYRQIAQDSAAAALHAPFATMVDAFVAMACLGFRMNRYEPLEKKQEISLSSYLAADTAVPALFSLALARRRAEEPDANIETLAQDLLHIRSILDVVEGWANGGLKAFREELEAAPQHGHLTERVIQVLANLKDDSNEDESN